MTMRASVLPSSLSARVHLSQPARRLQETTARAIARPRRKAHLDVTSKGLFGWLENNKDRDGRDEQWEIQQEMLKARKGGVNFDKVNERRQKVSKYLNKSLSKEEMKEIDDKNRKAANALSKEAMKGGIPLPMASFGMPEFDGGERFDLRAKYVDEGWVDEEAEKKKKGGFFKKMFNKKDKK
mmetsp:Transcript_6975/g.12056  ORF Transcript_6975/g.12056 Transcript_6975/m.12056 type:complete len:182 (-) Transcript_6975:415-960(-)|eukprot:CAMPEP_0198203906 /NCGR_PEP_ID=MMETSP1445-20131203/7234_1 /TAXON_ID=36898 /ORGANISM="Pyramimonas sp., Strain CCMP2087" /LENGTH=181 /DNA_ID=CAMNT_0043875495 /DNA_START=254 /DNA_END=799 /DNA_ORIENTATION=-